MWTPYKINIILHYHCSGGPWPLAGAPIFESTLRELQDLGLLRATVTKDCYETTERGRALVDMWCETPMPEQAWFDPRFSASGASS